MTFDTGSIWNDFGETTWPDHDLFSDESFVNNEDGAAGAHSDLIERHIRLLKIKPGNRGSIICCETRIVPLESAEEYTALSYTWGSAFPSQSIEVDKCDRHIPKNLWRFLQQARDRPDQFSGWLWTDMLSIDQTCARERTQQVSIMADIFRNAKKVVVWAGPAYGESDMAFDAISDAGLESKRSMTRIYSGPEASAIRNFCERPYWRRLWVFQELKFARNIDLMCGERLLPWTAFETFLLYARAKDRAPRLRDKVDAMINSPAGAMVELTLESLDTSLWALLKATKHLRCAVTYDKVYALLSVAQSGHEHISADYTIKMPNLLNLILLNLHKLSPPKGLAQVATQCKALENLFGVPMNTIFTLPAELHRQEGDAACYPTAYRLGPSKYGFSLWWTDVYGHTEVQRLLLRDWDYRWFQASQFTTTEEIQATKAVLGRCCFDVNSGPPGDRYLQKAIDLGKLAVLELLLALPGLQVDIKNIRGETPLHQAIGAGRIEILSALIALRSYELSRHLRWDSDFWTTYKNMSEPMRAILNQAVRDEDPIATGRGKRFEKKAFKSISLHTPRPAIAKDPV